MSNLFLHRFCGTSTKFVQCVTLFNCAECSINFGRLILECVSETAMVSGGTGDGANFGNRIFLGDVFLGVRRDDLLGLFTFLYPVEVGDFGVLSSATVLPFSKFRFFFDSLTAFAVSLDKEFFLDSVASDDLAKLFLTALDVTIEEGDGSFRVFVGVVGGG